jgi:hypothetical protein
MPASRQRQWGLDESIKLLKAINRCREAGAKKQACGRHSCHVHLEVEVEVEVHH